MSDQKTRRSRNFSTGRSRTTRRLRIFQRNHLLDFAKISKYFRVRSGKTFAHRGLVPMLGPNGYADRGCSSVMTFWTFKIFQKKCPTERPADRGISRPAGREHFADCGTSSVITFWTLSKFQNISKSAVGRDAPMKVSRLAGRERLADCGSSSVITFWTLSKFLNISRSVVGRDSPIGVLSLCSVQTDMPIADVPA